MSNFYKVKIDWTRKSCNTCIRGALRNGIGCMVSKQCGMDFKEWVAHKKYIKAGSNKIEKRVFGNRAPTRKE